MNTRVQNIQKTFTSQLTSGLKNEDISSTSHSSFKILHSIDAQETAKHEYVIYSVLDEDILAQI